MRFVLKNFHIIVFACVSLFSAAWIATEPGRAEKIARPLVEDAREVKMLATGAYRELRGFNWRGACDEFVTMYVTAMRMPSLVFERLADRLDKFNDDISKRAQGAPGLTPGAETQRQLAFGQADAMARAMP